jgi:tetratricopeptide (TPR) repeat protein
MFAMPAQPLSQRLPPGHITSAILMATAMLGGCVLRTAEYRPPSPPPPGSASIPAQPPPAPAELPSSPAARQFHLGAASRALVTQAHAQANSGDFGQASATIERALRIEPENPLLWIELGRLRLGAADADQADAMGRKALALGTGDPAAQAAAWRLIADALQALGRNAQAAEAARHAEGLAPR